jgi:hypothetical protein
MADPRSNDPRQYADPTHPDGPRVMPHSPYQDPAADPLIANQTVVTPSSGRGGLIAAGVIAVLLVIGLVAFTSQPGTDPSTTAVIPPQSGEVTPAPEVQPAPAAPTVAPQVAPEAPVDNAPTAAPTDVTPAPAD